MGKRERSLVIPREHGAWGILLVPLVTGACAGLLAGGSGGRLVPLTIVALSLFWLRTPVESWTGVSPIRAHTPGEFRLVRIVTVFLLLVSAAGLAGLFWGGRNRSLLWIGGAVGAAFLIQYVLRRISRRARSLAQMVGAAGLTATAPAAYYAVTERLDTTAWSLWAANLLFAVNQIEFVQLRIRAVHAANRKQKLSMGRGFFIGQAVMTALILLACAGHLFGWYPALAFLPLLIRGFAWFAVEPKPLVIHSLGKSELAYACVFGLLVVIGMQLP